MMKDLQKELEELAPSLSKIPKKNFEAPEGYFESFSEKMIDRIKRENIQSDAKVLQLKNVKKYLAAASIFIVLGISIYIYKIQANKTNTTQSTIEDIYLSELDESSLIDYHSSVNNLDEGLNIDDYQNYLDEQSIIEQL